MTEVVTRVFKDKRSSGVIEQRAYVSCEGGMSLGRSLSMLALINDGILEPGDKVLTFDYMVSSRKVT